MVQVRRAGLAAIVAVMLVVAGPAATRQTVPPTLPVALTSAQFWRLSSDISEPGGSFRSENLVSNEHTHQYVIPALLKTVTPGGVYLGVAPDQNFTYMVATRPRMAFILDIRRGNLLQHLLYKALFELSPDRATFVSRLFSKPRPPGLTPAAAAHQVFAAYAGVATSESLYKRNLAAVKDHLGRHHGFPLSVDDWQQLEAIYFAFFWDGPSLQYTSNAGGPGLRGGGGQGGGGRSRFPTYEEMVTQTDWNGTARSYLASEDNYRFIKGLEEKNLIVPVMGDFAGPKALRTIGRYLRERRTTVAAYYVSNVEQYLFQDVKFDAFARNVATLPVDANSTFIRSVSNRFGYEGAMTWTDGRATALYPIREFVRDAEVGLLRSYFDLNARSR